MTGAFIFDVDGVLADTPHEEAWREALVQLANRHPEWKRRLPPAEDLAREFTTELYRLHVSGKPREEGAAAALGFFGITDPEGHLRGEYCRIKQKVFLAKIALGQFRVYDDAILLLLEARQRGYAVVAASSSKNANTILQQIDPAAAAARTGMHYPFLTAKQSLLDLLDGNVCGITLGSGKPSPEIFLKAAEKVSVPPSLCWVIEDAVSGVQAAVSGKFRCVGIARLDNEVELRTAGALVVTKDLRTIFPVVFAERP